MRHGEIRSLLLALVGLAAAGGCVSVAGTFACEQGSQCVDQGRAGTCEPTGYCSFPDGSCGAEGRRYAAHAPAELAGTCAGDVRDAASPIDAVEVTDAFVAPCDFDGTLDEGEACDDGDHDATDACVDCVRATCGDGAVRAGVEECDPPGPGCSPGCLACAAPGVAAPDGSCWELLGASSYATASATCASRPGGHVAAPAREDELAGPLVQVLALSAVAPYVGLVDVQGVGDWSYASGELAERIPWAAGEPDGGTAARCAVAAIAGWSSVECTAINAAICEREPPVVRPTDGRAYRRDHAGRTAFATASGCPAGGGPAIIADAAELEFLRQTLPARADCGWVGGTVDFSGVLSWIAPGGAPSLPWAPGEPRQIGCLCVSAVGLGVLNCDNVRTTLCELGD